MVCKLCSNMVVVCLKTWSPLGGAVLIIWLLSNLVYTVEVTYLVQSSLNFVKKGVLIVSRPSKKKICLIKTIYSHQGAGQFSFCCYNETLLIILGHIYCPIFTKHGQNICPSWVWNWVMWLESHLVNLKRKLVYTLKVTCQLKSFCNLVRTFVY